MPAKLAGLGFLAVLRSKRLSHEKPATDIPLVIALGMLMRLAIGAKEAFTVRAFGSLIHFFLLSMMIFSMPSKLSMNNPVSMSSKVPNSSSSNC